MSKTAHKQYIYIELQSKTASENVIFTGSPKEGQEKRILSAKKKSPKYNFELFSDIFMKTVFSFLQPGQYLPIPDRQECGRNIRIQ